MLPQAEMEVLPNGLRIVYAPDDHAESVSFGLFVASGSRHEKASDAGASHFIEHMLFKGTRKRSALEISQAIEGRGGNFNAWTGEEHTCFFAYLPANFLNVTIDVLCDMYCNAAIPPAEFTRERAVILQEIKMYEDEPDAVVSENLSRLLFPDNALGLPVAGSAETLSKMTPAYLRRYLHKQYVPSATIAVVAGQFKHSEARRLICARLGKLPKVAPATFIPVTDTTPVKPSHTATRRDIQQAQMAMGYRTFGIHDKRRFITNVFDTLMGRTMSSRLFQAVREKAGLSYDVRSQMQLFQDVGGWCVTAGVDPTKRQKLMEVVETELDRICQRKPTAAELNRTKEYILGNFRLSFETPRAHLFYFGLSLLSEGRIVSPAEAVEKIAAVTAQDIQDLARDIINPANKAISWVIPQ